MSYLVGRFTSGEQMQAFWAGVDYDILDINAALVDMGLYKEMIFFSFHFIKPEIAGFFSNFKMDFDAIKNKLGIPKIYVDRQTVVDNNLDIDKAKRDKTQLKFNLEAKQTFKNIMAEIKKEAIANALQIISEAEKLVAQGIIKKEDIKLYEFESNYNKFEKEEYSE